MGFIAPAPPPVELEEWKRLSHLERGLVEEGYVEVGETVTRRPWLDQTGAFPVEVVSR
ncbi:MAG: hypothetical protein ACRDK7_13280 [Solirubrobacteraceae bacterium]